MPDARDDERAEPTWAKVTDMIGEIGDATLTGGSVRITSAEFDLIDLRLMRTVRAEVRGLLEREVQRRVENGEDPIEVTEEQVDRFLDLHAREIDRHILYGEDREEG
jgi:hypothetical protein